MKLLYLDCSSDYMTICVLSCVQDSATPWTVEPIRLLYPWGFSRQEQGSGLPWPPPEDLPNPIRSPSLQMDSLLPEPPWKPKNTGVGSLSLPQGVFLTQELNQGLLPSRRILYQLSHHGSPRILEWVAYPFSRGSSHPGNQTRVSCIAEGFFTL